MASFPQASPPTPTDMNISLEKRSVTCEIFIKFFQTEEGYSNNATRKRNSRRSNKLGFRLLFGLMCLTCTPYYNNVLSHKARQQTSKTVLQAAKPSGCPVYSGGRTIHTKLLRFNLSDKIVKSPMLDDELLQYSRSKISLICALMHYVHNTNK
jgi:hypothetical protein